MSGAPAPHTHTQLNAGGGPKQALLLLRFAHRACMQILRSLQLFIAVACHALQ